MWGLAQGREAQPHLSWEEEIQGPQQDRSVDDTVPTHAGMASVLQEQRSP